MKNYIKNNYVPLLFGFVLGVVFCYVLNLIDNIIIKIVLINSK